MLADLVKKYFSDSDEEFFKSIKGLFAEKKLEEYLKYKYPLNHNIKNDDQLYKFIQSLKKRHLKRSDPLKTIKYDNKIILEKQALGLHTTHYRNHGNKLTKHTEILIAIEFKKMPFEFLKCISVHELAHIKEKSHNKFFYKLCLNMMPFYNEVELDLRLYLIFLELGGKDLWE